MSTSQIISEISRMSLTDRIQVIEFAIKSFRKDTVKNTSLKEAAKKLQNEYETNNELTAFTSLDYQNFYETK